MFLHFHAQFNAGLAGILEASGDNTYWLSKIAVDDKLRVFVLNEPSIVVLCLEDSTLIYVHPPKVDRLKDRYGCPAYLERPDDYVRILFSLKLFVIVAHIVEYFHAEE